MFSSSVRRAALTAQPATIVCTAAPRAASAQAVSYAHRPQQRRQSSSKPSSPADGPDGVTDVAASPAQKTSSRNSKRKSAKEVVAENTVKGRDESMQNLPSVPSTTHLKSKDIAASAFFSLYRPLSVTASFPKNVTSEAFATIFTPRTRSKKTSDVISTLSNSVSKLELQASGVSESDIHHLDDPSGGAMKFPQHILSGKYQPFNAPPPPMPMDTEDSLAAGLEAAEDMSPANQERTYTAVLTIKESMDENGDVSYVAHSSPLELEEQVIEEHISPPNTFLERMQERQEKYEEYRENRAEETGMWAISVKRQRKLKMKKHKYKKLMRKTRNLRRRLDRN